MKKSMSLRLRLTMLCAALLTLCCLLLTLTNNLSAIQMADTIQAAPVLPAQDAADAAAPTSSLPMMELEASETVRLARGTFHVQSLFAMAAILAAGLFLIYRLVGKALAPLDRLAAQIRVRTAEELDRPLAVPDSGDEVAELARAFNPMSWRLNQAFVLQKNFSHNAAHEFRAPLAILKARIGLFRKKQDFQPQATLKFLGILESEADRLSAVVGSLLELTNLERMDRSETFTAAELLQTVSEELIPQAEARQVTLVVNVSSGSLVGNRELLHRAVFNLAENAVKYGPEGGIVNIVARHRDDWIRISVEDQGPRIPEYLRQRIFEPFFRVDAARSRQQGGAGLGLALVRAIAEAHGGLAYVRESGMGGNCFVLELPYPGGRVTSPP